MKKNALFFIVLSTFVVSGLSSQNLKWAKNMGGTGYNSGNSTAIDDSGHVYVTGFFSGTGDFDPGPGVTTFSTTSANQNIDDDIFISKSDTAGNLIWAKHIGGTNLDHALSIALDSANNIYIIGEFKGTVDFNPSPTASYTLTSAGGFDIFFAKYTTNGNFLWAKKLGSTNVDGGIAIAVDPLGNVYTTGVFRFSVDFDPGAGVTSYTTLGGDDAFVAKYDTYGNFRWAKQIGGTSGDFGYGIATDASGNAYTTGTFGGTVDFDPGPNTYTLTSLAGSDMFISKLDSSGNFLWAKNMGGSNIDAGNAVTVDASGNVYTTGFFWGAGDFDPGVGTYSLTPIGDKDIFVSKLDANGGFVWARAMGGTLIDAASAIAVDVAGNVYTTGGFAGTADFDPGPNTSTLTAVWGADIFISKLDANGDFVWVKQIGSAVDDGGKSIAVDTAGNIYTTGCFGGVADFDLGASGSVNLASTGPTDIYIARIGQDGGVGTPPPPPPPLGIENEKVSFIHLFPNPTSGRVNIVLNQNQSAINIQLINLIGETVLEKSNLSGDKIIVDVSDKPNGIYFITIKTETESFTQKIIINK
jgi:hypothetical protein